MKIPKFYELTVLTPWNLNVVTFDYRGIRFKAREIQSGALQDQAVNILEVADELSKPAHDTLMKLLEGAKLDDAGGIKALVAAIPEAVRLIKRYLDPIIASCVTGQPVYGAEIPVTVDDLNKMPTFMYALVVLAAFFANKEQALDVKAIFLDDLKKKTGDEKEANQEIPEVKIEATPSPN